MHLPDFFLEGKDRASYIAKVFKIIVRVSLMALVGYSCQTIPRGYHPAKKWAPALLKKDMEVLKSTLEYNHPGLYWYTSKDSLDDYYSAVISTLQDSLTELQFKNKVSWWISKIHCGHTSVRTSAAYAAYLTKHKPPQFPLHVKVWGGDSAVILYSLRKEDSALYRGCKLLSINGVPVKKLLDSMCALISTDGYSDNFKYQAISFNFPNYYQNAFGTDSQYTIQYLDTSGKVNQQLTRNFSVEAKSGRNTAPTAQNKPETRKQKKEKEAQVYRSLRTDTSRKMAIMEINTFSKGRLRSFFRKSFRYLRDEQIPALVIDLRRNTGGSINTSVALTKYLADSPFFVADTVAAFTRSLRNKKYIQKWMLYWLSMRLGGRKMEDDRVHFRFFEKTAIDPRKKYHYRGKIFLLTGGYTFSAATMVTNNLKGQSNVIVIGEETGGGSYGNCAIHIPDIILPYSRVRVRLPLFRVVINANIPKMGRGIFPDIPVYPNSTDIRRGKDSKLERVKELIYN